MTRHDPEIEELRDKVHCAVVLEQTPPFWKLDRKESTKLSLKYRRGEGEILIVCHAGRGWWDPTSEDSGDHFLKLFVTFPAWQDELVEPTRQLDVAGNRIARICDAEAD